MQEQSYMFGHKKAASLLFLMGMSLTVDVKISFFEESVNLVLETACPE